MRLLKNKEVRGALLWQLSVAVIACSLSRYYLKWRQSMLPLFLRE